jgi:hypothetical protein
MRGCIEMSKIISPEEITKRYVRNSLRAYLEGEDNCSLKWIKGVIKQSGIGVELLFDVFTESRDIGDQEKYKILFEICQEAQFNSKYIV